ncbi:MAG TPA: hypothetical protein VF698_15275 [Thermoanaerobaculia bacterium]|jgi:hypothetical protein
MSSTVAPVVFDSCRSRVDELLDANAPMGVVERMIEACALDREDRDALWLWASGRRDRLIGGASDCPIIGSTASTEAGDPRDTAGYPKGAGHD